MGFRNGQIREPGTTKAFKGALDKHSKELEEDSKKLDRENKILEAGVGVLAVATFATLGLTLSQEHEEQATNSEKTEQTAQDATTILFAAASANDVGAFEKAMENEKADFTKLNDKGENILSAAMKQYKIGSDKKQVVDVIMADKKIVSELNFDNRNEYGMTVSEALRDKISKYEGSSRLPKPSSKDYELSDNISRCQKQQNKDVSNGRVPADKTAYWPSVQR